MTARPPKRRKSSSPWSHGGDAMTGSIAALGLVAAGCALIIIGIFVIMPAALWLVIGAVLVALGLFVIDVDSKS